MQCRPPGAECSVAKFPKGIRIYDCYSIVIWKFYLSWNSFDADLNTKILFIFYFSSFLFYFFFIFHILLLDVFISSKHFKTKHTYNAKIIIIINTLSFLVCHLINYYVYYVLAYHSLTTIVFFLFLHTNCNLLNM